MMPLLLALALTVAPAVSPLPPSSPSQSSGELTFSPPAPVSGQGVEVVYRPLAALAGEGRLYLRARLRAPTDESYNQSQGSRTLVALERQLDGTFRGSFSLPREVVYGAFAVEDPEAEVVDTRGDRFWEILVHDSGGRPLFQALEQRFHDHMGRNQREVLETARQLARLHPEHPHAWTLLQAAESWVLGEEGAQEREAEHRERARAFHEAFQARDDVTAEEMGYLYWYARDEIRDRWRARLMEEHPGHFFAVQERAMELRQTLGDDPEALLQELEGLWEVAADDEARARVLRVAFGTARETGDPQTIRLWSDRWLETTPSDATNIAAALTRIPEAREEGIRLLEHEIQESLEASDEDRALGATREEHLASVENRVALLRQYLGEALQASGRVQEAVRVLEMAAEAGWSPRRFRSLGEAYREAGDSAGVLRAHAALAADPGMNAEEVDSLGVAAGGQPGEWEAAVQEARRTMVRRTLEAARDESLPTVRMKELDGSTALLANLLGEKATIVVFWSRSCGYSHQAMPRIAELAGTLREEGVPLLAVTGDARGEIETYLAENGWAESPFHVLRDTESEAAMAFDSWGTPQYYVVDGRGHLRFVSSLGSIPRQVAALREAAEGS